jgi:hypothetical protein
MAAFPCQRCDQRFDGQAKNAYLTIFEGEDKAAFRYVICGNCLEDLAQEWLDRGLHRGENGEWTDPEQGAALVGVFFSAQGGRNGSKSRW